MTRLFGTPRIRAAAAISFFVIAATEAIHKTLEQIYPFDSGYNFYPTLAYAGGNNALASIRRNRVWRMALVVYVAFKFPPKKLAVGEAAAVRP